MQDFPARCYKKGGDPTGKMIWREWIRIRFKDMACILSGRELLLTEVRCISQVYTDLLPLGMCVWETIGSLHVLSVLRERLRKRYSYSLIHLPYHHDCSTPRMCVLK